MKNKFLQKSSILIFGELITKILGVIYLIPLYLIDKNTGALSAVLYIPYAFVLVFASIGINNVMTDEVSKYVDQDERKLKRALHSGLFFSCITGLLASVMLYVLAVPIIHSLVPADSSFINEAIVGTKQLALAVVLFAITNFMRALLMGFGDVVEVSISYVLEQVVRVSILIGGVYYILVIKQGQIADTVSIFTASTILSILVTFVYFLYVFKKKGYFNLFVDTKYYLGKKKIKYIAFTGLIYFVNGIFITAFDQYDLFMLNIFHDHLGIATDEVMNVTGIVFNWSSKLVQIPIGLASAFFSMLIHSFNKAPNIKTARFESQKMIRIVYLYSIGCVAMFYIFAPYIYQILYQEYDLYGITIMKMQSMIIPFYVMQAIISIYILLNKRKDQVFRSNIILLVIKPILNLILIFTLGQLLSVSLFFITSIVTLSISIFVLLSNNKDLFNMSKKGAKSYIILTISVSLIALIVNQIDNMIPFMNLFVNLIIILIITLGCFAPILLKEYKKM